MVIVIPFLLPADSRDEISRKISKMTFEEYKAYKKTEEFKAYESSRSTHRRPPSTASTTSAKAADTIPKNRIILLTRPGCPYCTKAKNVLDRTGVRYKEYNVRKPYGGKLFKRYKGTGVPILVVGEKVLRGYNKQKYLDAIK